MQVQHASEITILETDVKYTDYHYLGVGAHELLNRIQSYLI